jgi:hypothetical protein
LAKAKPLIEPKVVIMRDTHERPVCHRAEDLVTFLYGESGEADALDFGRHLQQCDACRSEFTVFNQMHDSIQVWRNEALGASFDPVVIAKPATEATHFVRHERKLSALAALREFFAVAPLWLRGATAFAALLLFVLGALMVARIPRKPVETTASGGDKIYSREDLRVEVNKAVEKLRADSAQQNSEGTVASPEGDRRKGTKQTQLAVNQPKAVRPRGLNRQEREQLAADLRLTLPADDDDLLLANPDQDYPNR